MRRQGYGCIMEQRFDGKIWRDWNSMSEGEFPLFTNRVKAIVKWHNMELKRRAILNSAEFYHQRYLDQLAKAEKIRNSQLDLSMEKINGT